MCIMFMYDESCHWQCWVLSLTVMQTESHSLLWEMQILSIVSSTHCLLEIVSAHVHVLILLQNSVFSCKILLQYFTVPVNFQGTVALFFFYLLFVWYHQRDVTALTLSHRHQPFIQFRTVQNQLQIKSSQTAAIQWIERSSFEQTLMFDVVLVKAGMRILFMLYKMIIYNCSDYI